MQGKVACPSTLAAHVCEQPGPGAAVEAAGGTGRATDLKEARLAVSMTSGLMLQKSGPAGEDRGAVATHPLVVVVGLPGWLRTNRVGMGVLQEEAEKRPPQRRVLCPRRLPRGKGCKGRAESIKLGGHACLEPHRCNLESELPLLVGSKQGLEVGWCVKHASESIAEPLHSLKVVQGGLGEMVSQGLVGHALLVRLGRAVLTGHATERPGEESLHGVVLRRGGGMAEARAKEHPGMDASAGGVKPDPERQRG